MTDTTTQRPEGAAPHEHRKFARLYAPDPLDAGYRVRSLGRSIVQPPKSRSWTTGPILDQGATSECVRYGTTQLLATKNIVRPHALDLTRDLYPWAQAHDGIAGPHDGTAVRAGLQYAQKIMGAVQSYHAAYSMDEVLSWLSHNGPVVVGTEWLPGMDTPDAKGFVQATGKSRGGHCYDITRLNYPTTQALRWAEGTNSWGKPYGLNGKFRMTLDALEYLLFGLNGEAWCVIEAPVK